MAKIIRIPKTPKSAYDPARQPSELIRSHLANLEVVTAAGQPPAARPRAKRPRTESQASACIAELTARLQQPGNPAAANTPAYVDPAPPRTSRKRRRTRRAGAAKK